MAQAARAGEKGELKLDLLVEQDYDSNVFLREDDPIGSPVTYVRPTLAYENAGTLGYARFEGWLSSHTFWDESELNGVDRGVGIDVDRKILPRLDLFANGSYQRVAPHAEVRGADVVTISDPEPGVPGQPVIEPGQLIVGSTPNVDLGQAELGARYALTPRNKLTLSGGPFSVDYLEDPSGNTGFRDSDGWFGRLGLDRDMSPLDRLRLSLAASSTDQADVVSGTTSVPDFSQPDGASLVEIMTGKSASDQQSVSVGWDRTWSEVWVTRFSIGVRRLHSQTLGASRPITRVEPTSVGVTPFTDFVSTDFDDVGPGIIGSLLIQRAFPRGNAAFSYSRETRTTSSSNASDVNVDTFLASYAHRLSERATLSFVGSYEHYVSTNDINQVFAASYVAGSFNPITGPEFECSQGVLLVSGSGANKGGQCSLGSSSSLASDVWSASARLDWQLRKRLSTFVVLRYEERMGDAELFGNNYDRFNVGVGFTFNYSLGF